MARKVVNGTAVESISRLEKLLKGYPLRDPESQGVIVTREPPRTTTPLSSLLPKRKRKKPVSAKDAALQRNARRKLHRER